MTKNKTKTTGEVLADNTIMEMIYDPQEGKTKLVVGDSESQKIVDQLKVSDKTYFPYGANNALIKNNIVLLPSKIANYRSQEELVSEIANYINKYVELEPLFAKVCAHYVLLSWVYDGFNQLPYIRKCGDFGTGKTRFLTVVGSICYKPIFASGSSSTAAIFHTLDQYRGSLILDEADFRFSDEKADLTKVLNNGFTKGYPVLRCSFNKNKEYDPVGYQVYGCKILASRKHFDDPALESRFITEQCRLTELREDIPNELPASFESEALELRNKLLLFRFNMLWAFKMYKQDEKIIGVEPRISQIFAPLIQVSIDENFKTEVMELAHRCSKQIFKDRATSIEYHTLYAIRSLLLERDKVSVGDVSFFVQVEFGDFHYRKVTARWIGYVISKTLCIGTYKHSGRFYIFSDQTELLTALYLRYGVD